MKRWLAKHPAAGMGMLLFIVAFGLFSPSIFNAFVNWDDPFYVLGNLYLRHPERYGMTDLLFTPLIGYPVPFTVAVYRALHGAAGPNPAVFHLFNILIHASSAALLGRMLLRFFPPSAALLGALFFALHPIVAEPVAWVTGAKDLLALFFSLVSMNALLALLSSQPPRGALPVVLITSILALMSKPSAVALIPCLVVALLLFGPAPSAAKKGIVLTLVALCVLGAMFIAAGAVGSVGMVTVGSVTGPAAYVAGILEAAALQCRHLVLPVMLLPTYPPAPAALGPEHLVPVLLIVVVTVAVVHAIRQRNRPFLFFTSIAVFYYAPVSNLVPLDRFTADSYLYAPLAGIAGLFALLVDRLEKRLSGTSQRLVPLIAAGAVILLFGTLAFRQQRIWRNAETLWRAVLEVRPDDLRAREAYGGALVHMNEKKRALAYYRENEAAWRAEGWMPLPYMTLLAELGDDDGADALFVWSLGNSDYRKESVARNYIRFLLNTGRTPKPSDRALVRDALETFVDAAVLNAGPDQLLHIARLAGDTGAFDMAEALIARAIARDPEPIYFEMGRAACRAGKKDGCEKKWPVEKK